MKTEYLTAYPQPSQHRSRKRERNHDPSDAACGDHQHRQRAVSSPARSEATGSPKARARSPSAYAAPLPSRSPSPDILRDETSQAGVNEITRAFFSARPPAIPLWLAPLADPLPAPLLAPLPAPLSIAAVSAVESLIPNTCEKESLTEENEFRLRDASVETQLCDQSEFVDTLHFSRSTSFQTNSSPQCNVAVQTRRNLKTTPRDERDCGSFIFHDESREWAERLRDGHVRLALRALRQLRRAERLHRVLTRSTSPRAQLYGPWLN